MAVRTGLTPYQGEKLFGRELDIVITTDPLEGLDRKIDKRVYSEQFIVLTPKAIAPERYGREELRLLASQTPLVRFNSHSHLGIQVESLLRRLGVHASTRLEVDTADTLVAMVGAGLGWAVTTPTCLAQGMQYAEEVTISFFGGIRAARSIYVVGREGEHEKLFDACYDAAQEAVRRALLPALDALPPGLSDLVEMTRSP